LRFFFPLADQPSMLAGVVQPIAGTRYLNSVKKTWDEAFA
jgi:hypothetical protein